MSRSLSLRVPSSVRRFDNFHCHKVDQILRSPVLFPLFLKTFPLALIHGSVSKRQLILFACTFRFWLSLPDGWYGFLLLFSLRLFNRSHFLSAKLHLCRFKSFPHLWWNCSAVTAILEPRYYIVVQYFFLSF